MLKLIRAFLNAGVMENGLVHAAGYTNVDLRRTSLEGEELRAALEGVSMLGIRSRTQLTPEVLNGLRSVIAVGCFSVGTNRVDLWTARDMGTRPTVR